MENKLTIVFTSEDKEVAMDQTSFMKAYLDDHGIEANQQRKEIKPDEAGGELLPILTVLAPVAVELIKAITGWIKSRENDASTKSANLKVKIKDQTGGEIEFEASNFSESETELMEKFSERLSFPR